MLSDSDTLVLSLVVSPYSTYQENITLDTPFHVLMDLPTIYGPVYEPPQTPRTDVEYMKLQA